MIDTSLLPVAVVVLVVAAVAAVLSLGTIVSLAIEHARARRRVPSVQSLPVGGSTADARAA